MPHALRRVLAAFALLLAALPVRAVDERDLLPVDQAFVLQARAESRERIVLTWTIAEGYYLYRHRMDALPQGGFVREDFALPPGTRKRDPFFGDVETYRGRVAGVLTGRASGDRVTLQVKYQGCADIGICYPPQRRTLEVRLPEADGSAAGEDGLAALGRSLGGGPPLLGTAPGGQAQALPLPPEQAFRVEAIAGDGNTVLLRMTPARGYYLYRDKTSVRLEGAPGLHVALPPPARLPRGTPYRDEHFGQVTVYFDQVEIALPVRREHPRAAEARLVVGFQGCQDQGICYPPMTRRLALSLPAGTVTPVEPAAAPPVPGADTDTAASAPVPAAPPPDAEAMAADAAPAAPPLPSAAPRGANLSLPLALLLALLGGLVLNLMPCVLPVLSLKALSLVASGESPQRARRHALWYTAGVLVSFAALGALALALREAGIALGWGFQLQQPLVVAALGLLMFALGLSLSGVWHFGGAWTGLGQGLARRSGPLGDFFTGVLAVLVATPCTAPFMGAALGWAFTAPAATALAVFVALGLGLALPFLLIGFVPALARLLPRPGAWMETLKQLLAFPLYLTAAWLLWVLARQRGADAVGLWLLAAVALALAAWAYTQARMRAARWAGALMVLALLAMLWPLRLIHALPRPPAAAVPATTAAGAVAFSEQRLADLRAAGRVVLVNVTADWCVTCKANEKAVFESAAFREALAAADAVYMVADWTDVDPAITAFLQRHKAVGVPLYVIYPRGGGEGVVLPTVLTPQRVRTALQAAAR